MPLTRADVLEQLDQAAAYLRATPWHMTPGAAAGLLGLFNGMAERLTRTHEMERSLFSVTLQALECLRDNVEMERITVNEAETVLIRTAMKYDARRLLAREAIEPRDIADPVTLGDTSALTLGMAAGVCVYTRSSCAAARTAGLISTFFRWLEHDSGETNSSARDSLLNTVVGTLTNGPQRLLSTHTVLAAKLPLTGDAACGGRLPRMLVEGLRRVAETFGHPAIRRAFIRGLHNHGLIGGAYSMFDLGYKAAQRAADHRLSDEDFARWVEDYVGATLYGIAVDYDSVAPFTLDGDAPLTWLIQNSPGLPRESADYDARNLSLALLASIGWSDRLSF
ncbi:MAG: hypothetical protein WED00_13630 [Aquisalimonadaceae bacterium]